MAHATSVTRASAKALAFAGSVLLTATAAVFLGGGHSISVLSVLEHCTEREL